MNVLLNSLVSIPIIASGGVTTSLVLPGSANIIGGEAYAIKNRVPPSLSVNGMLVEGNATNAQRYMKFACGGNPKKFHAKFPERPKSRMGIVLFYPESVGEPADNIRPGHFANFLTELEH